MNPRKGGKFNCWWNGSQCTCGDSGYDGNVPDWGYNENGASSKKPMVCCPETYAGEIRDCMEWECNEGCYQYPNCTGTTAFPKSKVINEYLNIRCGQTPVNPSGDCPLGSWCRIESDGSSCVSSDPAEEGFAITPEGWRVSPDMELVVRSYQLADYDPEALIEPENREIQ